MRMGLWNYFGLVIDLQLLKNLLSAVCVLGRAKGSNAPIKWDIQLGFQTAVQEIALEVNVSNVCVAVSREIALYPLSISTIDIVQSRKNFVPPSTYTR